MEQVLSAAAPYAPVAIIIAVALLLTVAARFGWVKLQLPWVTAEREPASAPIMRAAESAEMDARAVAIALEQYGEVATALEVLVRATPTEIEHVAREWFSTLATRLATRLKEDRDHHYRVAIWLDDPQYADHFVSIGHGLFSRHDPTMDRLERKYTIGGLAFESTTMSYYCRDRRTDPNYKPRQSIPPSYESLYGLALGKPFDRWGVMTVDARQANGFPEDAQWLIRRFGELASLGAVIWAERARGA